MKENSSNFLCVSDTITKKKKKINLRSNFAMCSYKGFTVEERKSSKQVYKVTFHFMVTLRSTEGLHRPLLA